MGISHAMTATPQFQQTQVVVVQRNTAPCVMKDERKYFQQIGNEKDDRL